MHKQKQEGALALVSWSSFLCRTQADVASGLLAEIQMKLVSRREESSKRRWRERYQGRRWVSRTRGSVIASRLGGRFPDFSRSHHIPSAHKKSRCVGLPKIKTSCRKLDVGAASGNPEYCKQFGFVLNALDPPNRPFRTVYICRIATISAFVSVICRPQFEPEWVPSPP